MNQAYLPENPGALPPFTRHDSLTDATRYLVPEPLQRAVNVAIWLGQPLLLTGEPGTGKTQLAHHLARHFGTELHIAHIKTASVASDLFYQYDAIRHFQYAQNNKTELEAAEVEARFVRYQALGAAIKSGRREVVLIDEIDKAPRDLPNDILDAMENLAFEVPEIGKVGANKIKTAPEHRPVVILTSNSEKNLPDAFLRRCVYYHIAFPGEGTLLEILEQRISGYRPKQLMDLVKHFTEIRAKVRRKKPATAELLQWVAVLQQYGFDPAALKDPKALTADQKALLQSSYAVLIKDKEDLEAISA